MFFLIYFASVVAGASPESPPWFEIAPSCDNSRDYDANSSAFLPPCSSPAASVLNQSLALQLSFATQASGWSEFGIANYIIVVSGAAFNCRQADYDGLSDDEALQLWHEQSDAGVLMSQRWSALAAAALAPSASSPSPRHVMIDCEAPDLVRPKNWRLLNATQLQMVYVGVKKRIAFARQQLRATDRLSYYGFTQPRNGVKLQESIDLIGDAADNGVFEQLHEAVANAYIGEPASTLTVSRVNQFTQNCIEMAARTNLSVQLLLWPRQMYVNYSHSTYQATPVNLFAVQLDAAAAAAASIPLSRVAWWQADDSTYGNELLQVFSVTKPYPKKCCNYTLPTTTTGSESSTASATVTSSALNSNPLPSPAPSSSIDKSSSRIASTSGLIVLVGVVVSIVLLLVAVAGVTCFCVHDRRRRRSVRIVENSRRRSNQSNHSRRYSSHRSSQIVN